MADDKAPCCGTITITEEGKAPQTFSAIEASFGVMKVRDEYRWHFAVEGADYTINADAKLIAQTGDPTVLFSVPIVIPLGYSEETEDYLATLYYYEHEDLDENTIVCDHQIGSLFRLRWTGRSGRVSVDIRADFKFEGLEEVPRRIHKIMLISKSESIRNDLRDILDSFGYEVIGANVPTAMEAFRQHPQKNLLITAWLSSDECGGLVSQLRSNGFNGKIIAIMTALTAQERKYLEALRLERLLELPGLEANVLLKIVENI